MICLFSTKVTKTFFDEKIKNSVEFSKTFFSKILNFRGKQTNYHKNFLDPKSMKYLLQNEPYSVNVGQKLIEL